ncbi:UDP-glucose 4-epimerase [Crocosphaera watsonii WH 0402]|uniref:UDP-glucose 4-epimerase n=2 Tax=Crocosphaera watsonii TaxID=263511 RepID=T2JZ53_CROWT|nr:UDP-glucose 4-epimerase [Crocosphaera watsonii WH 0401]CCQ70540.1 UDP-glucose 4-epimerase [Crocosphaera watsonii WH 0402]
MGIPFYPCFRPGFTKSKTEGYVVTLGISPLIPSMAPLANKPTVIQVSRFVYCSVIPT